MSSQNSGTQGSDITRKQIVLGAKAVIGSRRLPNGDGTGYQLGQRLDGAGEVYEASHPLFSCPLVVKLFPWAEKDNVAAVKAFFKEAGRVSLLRHPAIAQVLDLGLLRDRTPFVSMERLWGRTLEQHLADKRPLSVSETMPLLRGIASALAEAHNAGVVHREIRPDNVFIVDRVRGEASENQANDNDTSGRVKVLDFGVSRLTWAGPWRGPGALSGRGANVNYLAPEQILGGLANVDVRADQYALAALTYRMLTGSDPFPATSASYDHASEAAPRSITPSIHGTSALDAVLVKALSRNPTNRFASVTAFLRAFEEAIASAAPTPGAIMGAALSSSEAAISDAVTKEMQLPEVTPPRSRPRISTKIRDPRGTAAARRDPRAWQGAVTQQFFDDGDRQEADEWESSPLVTDTPVDPDIEFDSFDRVPRRTGPRVATALVIVGLFAGIGWWATTHRHQLGWLSLSQLRTALMSAPVVREPIPTAPAAPTAAAPAAATPSPPPSVEPAVPPVEPVAANNKAAPPARAAAPPPAPPVERGVDKPAAAVVPGGAASQAEQPRADQDRQDRQGQQDQQDQQDRQDQRARQARQDQQDQPVSPEPSHSIALRGYVWSPAEGRLVPSDHATAPQTAPAADRRSAPGAASPSGAREPPIDSDAPLPPAQ